MGVIGSHKCSRRKVISVIHLQNKEPRKDLCKLDILFYICMYAYIHSHTSSSPINNDDESTHSS